jgi:malonate transporter
MLELLGILVPVFGLIGLGYGARAVGLLGPRAGEGLSEFVFVLAVPTLIFRTMAEAKLPDAQPWGFWLAYFAALAIVWAIGTVAARALFAQDHATSVVAGFAAGQSNTVMVGIPLILRAFGEAGAAPLFLLIAVHLPLILVVATAAIEGADRIDPRDLARRLALNPILLGLAVGLLWRWTGWSISGPLRQLVDSLSPPPRPARWRRWG